MSDRKPTLRDQLDPSHERVPSDILAAIWTRACIDRDSVIASMALPGLSIERRKEQHRELNEAETR